MGLFYLVCLALLAVGTCALGGMVVGVSPRVLNRYVVDYIEVLEPMVASTKIPDVIVPLVKNKDFATDFVMTGIEVEAFKIPREGTQMSFTNSQDLVIQSEKIYLSMGLVWKVQSHHKKGVLDSGKASVSIDGSSLLLIGQMTGDMDKWLKPVKAQFDVGKIKIIFDKTPMKVVINWLVEQVNEKIKALLQEQISRAADLGFKAIAAGLPSLRTKNVLNLSSWMSVNLTLTELPVIDEDLAVATFDGTIRDVKSVYDISAKAKFIDYKSKFEVGIYVSEYTLNTLSQAYFQNKPFSVRAEDLGLLLNTDILDPLFPGILEYFGETSVKLHCSQRKELSLNLEVTYLHADQELECVVLTDTEDISRLLVNLYSKIELTESSNIIRGKFVELNVKDVKVEDFIIDGSPDTENIKSFINGLLTFAKPFVSNKVFGSGILVPSLFTHSFSKFKILMEKDLLIIEGDLID